MPLKMNKTRFEKFVHGYITAALWSSTYETDDRDDNPMDDGEHELSQQARDAMTADCLAFWTANDDDLEAWATLRHGLDDGCECAGHDFWLTRNGHGTGFWDRFGKVQCSCGRTLESCGDTDHQSVYCGACDICYHCEEMRTPHALGEVLSDLARKVGERYLYIGDDGQIYQQ